MECKRALEETDGDIDRAVEVMRRRGLAKADRKASRTTAEGRLALVGDARAAALVEVNSETDFVAGGEEMAEFGEAIATLVLAEAPRDLTAAGALKLPSGLSVEENRRELVAKLGENIALRRFARMETATGIIGRYLHGIRIGVLVELSGASDVLAKDIAMHIAASRPLYIEQKLVPKELLMQERDTYRAQAEESGKPAAIVSKMVEGRIAKYLDEITLLGQPFVKEPERSVGELLESSGARVIRFVRYEVGEGIEREEKDFAADVMAQVRKR